MPPTWAYEATNFSVSCVTVVSTAEVSRSGGGKASWRGAVANVQWRRAGATRPAGQSLNSSCNNSGYSGGDGRDGHRLQAFVTELALQLPLNYFQERLDHAINPDASHAPEINGAGATETGRTGSGGFN